MDLSPPPPRRSPEARETQVNLQFRFTTRAGWFRDTVVPLKDAGRVAPIVMVTHHNQLRGSRDVVGD